LFAFINAASDAIINGVNVVVIVVFAVTVDKDDVFVDFVKEVNASTASVVLNVAVAGVSVVVVVAFEGTEYLGDMGVNNIAVAVIVLLQMLMLSMLWKLS